MKAIAVFPQRKEIHLINHEMPHITHPTQVKLHMIEVGICGTDKEICSFHFGTPPDGFDYLILGHEALGEVVEVGSGVQHLKPGDLVVPVVRRPCNLPNCRACQADQQDFCYTGDYTEYGIKSQHGYMAEFVVDDERYMHLVPPSLRDVAVLTEPLTIAEKAFSEVWQIQQRLPWLYPEASAQQPGKGLQAVVLGAGPIGLLGAMLLVTAGFRTFVYSRSPVPNPKAALTEAIGATYISSETTPVEEFACNVGQIDLVYEALGGSALSFEVMRHLGRNGIFSFTGAPDFGTTTQEINYFMSRLVVDNQVVFGTVNAGHDAFASAIRHLEVFSQRWPEALRSVISARHPLGEAPEILLGKPGGIKHVITITS
jgi:threonine dehydrogenase-like Zn-dependent dehydrogenase